MLIFIIFMASRPETPSFLADIASVVFEADADAITNLRKLIKLHEYIGDRTMYLHFYRLARMIAIKYANLAYWKKSVGKDVILLEYTEWNEISNSIFRMIRVNMSNNLLVCALLHILRALFRVESVKMLSTDFVIFQEIFKVHYMDEKVCNAIVGTIFNIVSEATTKHLCSQDHIIMMLSNMMKIHNGSIRVCGKSIALIARVVASGVREHDKNIIADGKHNISYLERNGSVCKSIDDVKTLFDMGKITMEQMNTICTMFHREAYYAKYPVKDRLKAIDDSTILDTVILCAKRFPDDTALMSDIPVLFRNMGMDVKMSIEMGKKGVFEILFNVLVTHTTKPYVLKQVLSAIINLICEHENRVAFYEMHSFLPYITMLLMRWRNNFNLYHMLNRIICNSAATKERGGPIPLLQDMISMKHPVSDYKVPKECVDMRLLDENEYEIDALGLESYFNVLAKQSLPALEDMRETKTLIQTLFDVMREVYVDMDTTRKMQSRTEMICITLETLGRLATYDKAHDVIVAEGLFKLIDKGYRTYGRWSKYENSIQFLLQNMAHNFNPVLPYPTPIDASLFQYFFGMPSDTVEHMTIPPTFEGCVGPLIRPSVLTHEMHAKIWVMLSHYGIRSHELHGF